MQEKYFISHNTYFRDEEFLRQGYFNVIHVAAAVAYNLMLQKLQKQGVNVPDDIKLEQDQITLKPEMFLRLGRIVAREKGLTPNDVFWEDKNEKKIAQEIYANKKETTKVTSAYTREEHAYTWEEHVGFLYWYPILEDEWNRITEKDISAPKYNQDRDLWEYNIKEIIEGIEKRKEDTLKEKTELLKTKLGKNYGQTADIKTGKASDEHRETAKISRALIDAKRVKEGKGK